MLLPKVNNDPWSKMLKTHNYILLAARIVEFDTDVYHFNINKVYVIIFRIVENEKI